MPPDLDQALEAISAHRSPDPNATMDFDSGLFGVEQPLEPSALPPPSTPPPDGVSERTQSWHADGHTSHEALGLGKGRIELPEVDDDRYGGVRGDGVEEIGRGGLGRVIAAWDEATHRRVAYKELLSNKGIGSADPEASSRRFLLEARVTARLEHPSIVPIHDLGRRPDGTLFYTMKLVEGETLADALERCTSLADRLRLLGHFADLCHAIAYAHSRGVVHRDIKPANVMLGRFGETVVLDWGLAKVRGTEDLRRDDIVRGTAQLAQDNASLTMEGAIFGTPAYMSPEQAFGRIAEMDERTDVWSLGAVLVEILTGAPPYGNGRALELLEKIRTESVPSVREIVPSAPAELEAICSKALSRHLADRYRDASGLARDIEAFQEGRLVGAYAYNSLDLVRRFIERNKVATMAVLVTLLILMGGSVLLFRAWQLADHARAQQLALREVAEGRAEEARVARDEANLNASLAHANLARALTASARRGIEDSHHGRALVFAAGAAEAWARAEGTVEPTVLEQAELASVRYDALTGRRLRLAEVSRTLPFNADAVLSADGTRLAHLDPSGEVVLRSVPAGQELGRWDAAGTDYVLDISSDNTRVVTGLGADAAIVWDVATGSELTRSGVPLPRELRRWAVSADARRVAHVRSDGTLRLWDLHPPTELPSHRFDRAQRLDLSDDGSILAVGDGFGAVHLVRLDSGSTRRVSIGSHPIMTVELFDAGRSLLVADESGEVHVIDTRTGAAREHFATGRQLSYAACLGRCDELLVADKTEGQVRATTTGSLVSAFPVREHTALQVATAGLGGAALVIEGQRLQSVTTAWTVLDPLVGVAEAAEDIVAATLSPDARRVVVGTTDGRLALHDLATRRVLARAALPVGRVQALRYSPDGSAIAVLDATGTLRRLDASDLSEQATASVLPPLRSLRGLVDQTFVWTQDQRLIVAGVDNHVHVYSSESLSETSRLQGLTDLPWAVAASADGSRVAATSMGGDLALWDRDTGEQLHLGPTTDKLLLALDLSPDGTRAVWSGVGGIPHVVDTSNWEVVCKLEGHLGFVNRVRFSPDGTRILTGSEDGTARLWDATTGRLAQIFRTGVDTMVVEFSSRGDRVLVGFGTDVKSLPLQIGSPPHRAADALAAAEAELGWRLEGVELLPEQLVAPRPGR